MLSFLANSADSSKVKIGMRRLSVYLPPILIQSVPPNLIVLLSKCSYYGLFYIPIALKLNFLLNISIGESRILLNDLYDKGKIDKYRRRKHETIWKVKLTSKI